MQTYKAFREPTPYEVEKQRAERQRKLAEFLQQQAMVPEEEPYTFQGFRAMPSPANALSRVLQAYTAKKVGEKAEQAEARAREADIAGAERLRQELAPQARVAAPTSQEIAASVGMPQIAEDGTVSYGQTAMPKLGIEQVMPTAQERERAIEEALFSGTPRAQKYAQFLMAQRPEAEEFGTTPVLSESGEYVVFGKGGTARPTGVRGAPKAADMPNAVREYEYAKSQGYTGSFADWELRNRQAGAPRFVMPSEGERKDAYNLGRIVNAVETIKNATSAEPSAVTPGFMETVIGAIPFAGDASYLAQSKQRQIVTSAQTDLIDAALTLATGAAYTKEQLEGQRQALLPRFGESEESIAAKSKRLEALISAAKVRAGRAWTPELESAVRSAFATPSVNAAPVSSAPPAGVTPEEWSAMTPEERQLWQK